MPLVSTEPRIVHLDDGRLWRGGQHQVLLLLTELAAQGLGQLLVTREGSPLGEKARAAGLRVECVNYHGELDFTSPRRIAGLARGFGANIIHAHTGHAHTFAGWEQGRRQLSG
jgi:hypothetical protein